MTGFPLGGQAAGQKPLSRGGCLTKAGKSASETPLRFWLSSVWCCCGPEGDPAPLRWVLFVKNATASIQSTSVIWKTKLTPSPTLPCPTIGKKKLIKHWFLGFCSAIKVQSNVKPNRQPPIVRIISRTQNWILQVDINWNERDLRCWLTPHTGRRCSAPPAVVPRHPLDETSGQQQGGGGLGSYWFCCLLPESHRL